MSPATITHPPVAPGLAHEPRRTRPSRGAPPPRPPRDEGEGGGGGRGDEGPPAASDGREGVGPFALALTLIGVTLLFGVLIAVWLLLRRPSPDWHSLSEAGALRPLWVSTGCLLASSATLEIATRRARRGLAARRAALAWLVASLALGLAFLGAQGWLWLGLARRGLVPSSGGHAAVLYSLTGLHALHVYGGLAFLLALAVRLSRARAALPSLRLGALYWHYMGALWLVLFGLLAFVR